MVGLYNKPRGARSRDSERVPMRDRLVPGYASLQDWPSIRYKRHCNVRSERALARCLPGLRHKPHPTPPLRVVLERLGAHFVAARYKEADLCPCPPSTRDEPGYRLTPTQITRLSISISVSLLPSFFVCLCSPQYSTAVGPFPLSVTP